jgi:4-methyl-5(b-hydroxyethyl)-thiazole monophosphate biosynthesis
MNIRVLCLLAEGFEEIETVTPIDLLRRAGVDVVVAAIGASTTVTGRSAITLLADVMLDEVPSPENFDLLLIPGGPGVAEIRKDGRAADLVRDFHARGQWIAAICAAPLVLQDAGLLAGRRFTAHQSVRNSIPAALDDRVVIDGRLITSRGAGTVIDFSLAIITALVGADAARHVAIAIMA